MSDAAVRQMRSRLAYRFARKIIAGLSLIACGLAAGVAAASHHRLAVAIAVTALVVEIGAAIAMALRGLRAFDEMTKADR